MKNWKASDLKVRGILVKPVKGKIKLPKKEPEGLTYIKNHLTLLKIPYETELKFHSKRKFRFDISISKLKIAIEYEGLVSKKSRHTTIKGYTNDTEKYNLSQLEGWIVLRYTVINYKNFINDLDFILSNIKMFEERCRIMFEHHTATDIHNKKDLP